MKVFVIRPEVAYAIYVKRFNIKGKKCHLTTTEKVEKALHFKSDREATRAARKISVRRPEDTFSVHEFQIVYYEREHHLINEEFDFNSKGRRKK